MRYLETSTVCMAIHSQVCFHRQLFADRVKPHWCITGPMEPLGCTNQSWCGVKLLTMSVLTHPVGCVHICHTCWEASTVLCTLITGFARLRLATHPHHPTPPHPLPPVHHLYTTSVILQGL